MGPRVPPPGLSARGRPSRAVTRDHTAGPLRVGGIEEGGGRGNTERTCAPGRGGSCSSHARSPPRGASRRLPPARGAVWRRAGLAARGPPCRRTGGSGERLGRGRPGFLNTFVLSFLQLSTLRCPVILLLLFIIPFPTRGVLRDILQPRLFARFLLRPLLTFAHPVRFSGVLGDERLSFRLCAFAASFAVPLVVTSRLLKSR